MLSQCISSNSCFHAVAVTDCDNYPNRGLREASMLEFYRPIIPFDEVVSTQCSSFFVIGFVGGFKFDREFRASSHHRDGGCQPAWL